jgi:glycosyltransferase involved in cell wall biosynthesis
MKVLEINSVCGLRSTGRIACQIADTVVSQGGEATVAYGRDYYPQGCNVPVYRIGSDLSTLFHAGFSKITDRQGFYSRQATRNLIGFVKDYNPDIIHLHNVHGYYLNLPLLFHFLEEFDKPVVWTLHDCWAFTGHCAYFDFVGCPKWKDGCYECPQKKGYPASFVLDNSKRNWLEKKELFTSIKNLTIVTPSLWLADLVKQSFFKDTPVQVIHNGIDLDVFKPESSAWKADHTITKPIVLACAAQWDRRKGYEDVKKLSELLPECQIVIVGVSEKQANELPKEIISIQKTKNIQDLVMLYNSADIFVNPTYEDNFPTVNLESLACGTPVITYDTGGSPESLNLDCGFIVSKGNVEIMAIKAREVLANSKYNYKEACILRAGMFGKKEKFEEYQRLFEKFC